jgi:NADP-dependent 3-hydroxy acid dehydrogenase YdfG
MTDSVVSNRLQEQVVAITGGGSGIGEAIAKAFAAQGARLCLVGRRTERLEAVAKQVQHNGYRATLCAADLTKDEDMDLVVSQLHSAFDRLDVLVHSAGQISLGETEKASLADLDRQYRINVRAPYSLTKAMLPMLRKSRGHIVFINSTAGTSAKPGTGQYSATKHALKAIADSLRGEVNQDGVRVLTVHLGRTATAFQAEVNQMEGVEYRPERYIQPTDVASVVLNALSLPRTAEVTDIHLRPMLKTY